MNTKEAMRVFLDGHKIRNVDWEKGRFRCLDERGLIRDSSFNMTGSIFFTNGCEWEIYKEPQKEITLEEKVNDLIKLNVGCLQLCAKRYGTSHVLDATKWFYDKYKDKI